MLKKLLKHLTGIVVGTIVCLVLIEVGIRVVYLVRNSSVEFVPIPYMVRNTGVAPPWMDALRILEPDDALMYRGQPNAHRKYLDLFCPMSSEDERWAMLRRFRPSIPDEFKNNPTWEVSLNSEGFRDVEFPASKPPDTLRVVTLGDSWTLGHNVDQNDNYPQRLRSLLTSEFPSANIEVFNLGMLASTSHEGVELLKTRALSLEPDIVLIGYGMNDSAVSGWRDKDVLIPKPKSFSLKRFIMENSELYRLATYLGQIRKSESVSMSDQLRTIADPNAGFLYEAWVSADALEAADYERLESKTRVSPPDYEKNIREMVRVVREHGAAPVLLHNDLRPGSPYQAALRRISQNENVPFVDNCELLFAAKRRIEAELQQRLGLQPSLVNVGKGKSSVQVVFRVNTGDRQVARSMYIAGPHSQLGDATPNSVAMYDDGTHGDEKAGDHVWSLAVTFSPGQKIFYVYTNSGEDGKWQNTDIPKVRTITVPAGAEKFYAPVNSFGELYLQADGFHTNAQGYALMAQAIRDAVVQTDKFRTFSR